MKGILSDVFSKRNLDNKVISITSEGAANILKALSDSVADDTIEDSHRCICHTLHLIVTAALKLDGVSKIVAEIKSLSQTFRRSHEWAEELRKTQLSKTAEGDISVAEDLLDIEDQPAPEAEPEEYIGQPLKLLQDVVTRWSNTFKMIERALKLKENIRLSLAALVAEERFPSAASWKALEYLVQF